MSKPCATCQHIMPSGRLCECPQILGTRLCINHSRDHQRLRNLAKAREIKLQGDPSRPGCRPEDDLNAAIFDSLQFPALEDTAAISITLSNAARLLGGHHISVRAAECITNMCRIAEINLRKGHAFFHDKDYIQPGLTDTDPVKPFGDAEGFVLPEEHVAHSAHQQLVADFGADRAHAIRTELGFNDHMLEPMAQKEQTAQAGEPVPRKLEEQTAQAGMPVPPSPSEGHDFSRAEKPARSAHRSAEGSTAA